MSPQTTAARKLADDVRIAPIGRASRRHSSARRAAQPRSSAQQHSGERLARFLGYFSLALGLAELLAPRQMSELIGIDADEGNRKLLRAFGAREVLNGIAVLASDDPTKAMWGRVSGDALDLACLGTAMANSHNDRRRTAFATANVLAVAAADVVSAVRLTRD